MTRAARWFKRGAIALGALLALAWSGASVYLYVKQGSMVYLPARDFARTPKDLGLMFEDLRLTVKRAPGVSETVNAWWLPAQPAAGQNNAPNGLSVLFLHGNARNMGATGNNEKIAVLARAGFNVMTLDYRGFGKSDGDAPYEAALYEDTLAAFEEFKRRTPDKTKRVLHGHSMGGAVAIDLASKRPGEFAAAFIEATFSSMLDMSTINPLYRLLPVDTLLTERFDSSRKVASLKLPLLLIHGTADSRIPHTMSKTLYALAPERKSIILVDGATHNNLHTFSQYGEAYRLLLGMAKP